MPKNVFFEVGTQFASDVINVTMSEHGDFSTCTSGEWNQYHKKNKKKQGNSLGNNATRVHGLQWAKLAKMELIIFMELKKHGWRHNFMYLPQETNFWA